MGKNPEIEKKYFEVSTVCGSHPMGELYVVALASSLGKAFSIRTQGEDPPQPSCTAPTIPWPSQSWIFSDLTSPYVP